MGNLRRAASLLAARDGIQVSTTSRVYETDPVGPPQPDYLNAVVEIQTDLDGHALLRSCLSIEEEMGRVRGRERWGPRVIDLDVLVMGDRTIDEPGLSVPHPRMHERAFVLVPLLELVANPQLPGGRSIGSLRPQGAGFGRVRLVEPALTRASFHST